MVKKKRNPADLTKRNNDARKKEIERLRERITKLEDIFIAMVLEVRTMGKQLDRAIGEKKENRVLKYADQRCKKCKQYMLTDGVKVWCSSCKLKGVGKW